MGIGILMGLLLAVPIILPPVLFVWYMNTGGLVDMVKLEKAKRSLQTQRS